MLISSAQNFEDIILMRAFQGMKGGNYIDIGANDPTVDSVSYLFFSNGWHGVHVEPSEHYARLLREARPDDIVIQKFVSSSSGVIKFYDFPGTGWGTSDEKLAQSYKEGGHDCIELQVPTTSLSEIFKLFKNKDIHWLKIDVEGAEKDVLEGWGDSPVRPWVVVIESIEPVTHAVNSNKWAELIQKKGYEKVYFDGINEFYLHEDRREIEKYFGPGPNIFDGEIIIGREASPVAEHVVRGIKAELQAKVDRLEAEARAASQNAASLDEIVKQKTVLLDRLTANGEAQLARLNELETSKSALESSKNALESSKNALQASKDALEARYEELRRRCESLEGKAVEFDASYARLLRSSDELGDLAIEHERTVTLLERQLQDLRAEHQQLLDTNHNHFVLATERQRVIVGLSRELEALRTSTSWRVTSPMRFLVRTLRWVRSGIWSWITLRPGSRPRRMARRLRDAALGKRSPAPLPLVKRLEEQSRTTSADVVAFTGLSPRQREIFEMLSNTEQRA